MNLKTLQEKYLAVYEFVDKSTLGQRAIAHVYPDFENKDIMYKWLVQDHPPRYSQSFERSLSRFFYDDLSRKTDNLKMNIDEYLTYLTNLGFWKYWEERKAKRDVLNKDHDWDIDQL